MRRASLLWRGAAAHWLPLMAFVVAVQAMVLGEILAGQYFFAATNWSRFDSALYLQIADHGYQLFHCHIDSENWCGNAGWFPAYPYVMAVVGKLTPLSTTSAGVLVSWTFSLATLVLLWRTFLGRRTDAAAIIAIAFAAFAPGQIYRFTVFPMGMLSFFAVLSMWLATQRRWIGAGLAAAVVGASYHLGALIVPILAVYAFAVSDGSAARRLRGAATAGGLALAGPLITFLVMRAQTGAWDAFFKIQSKYEHVARDPFTGFWDEVKGLFDGNVLWVVDLPGLQTLVATLIVLAVVIDVGVRGFRRAATRTDWLLLAWGVVMWAFPLSQSNVAVYRNYALLLPIAPLVARLPKAVAVVLVAELAWLSVPLTELFLTNKLI